MGWAMGACPLPRRRESTGCVCQVSLLARRQLGQETLYTRGSLQGRSLEGPGEGRGEERFVCRPYPAP